MSVLRSLIHAFKQTLVVAVCSFTVLGLATYAFVQLRASNPYNFPERMMPLLQAPERDPYRIYPVAQETHYGVYTGFTRPDGSGAPSTISDHTFAHGDWILSRADIRRRMPPIHSRHVNRDGYVCDFFCVNSDGAIVGWNPLKED